MAIMHHINKKQLWFLLIISFMFFAGTYMRKDAAQKQQEAALSDIELDNRLLEDLKSQEFVVDEKSSCIMQCNQISENDLKAMFSAKNLDYNACDFKNCHLTTYAIEGTTPSGKQVRFKVETGEEGNAISQLEVSGNCAC
jgi:hypothetical protein